MNYNVIVADDERKIRNSIISKIEWDVLGLCLTAQAQDGDELCDLLDTNHVDLIITDLKMPGRSEIELLEYLSIHHPEVCIIVISGFDDYCYMKQAIRSNVFDYLLKPINASELNEILKQALKKIKENEERRCKESHMERNRRLALENIWSRFLAGEAVDRVELFSGMEPENQEKAVTYIAVVMWPDLYGKQLGNCRMSEVLSIDDTVMEQLLAEISKQLEKEARAIRISNSEVLILLLSRKNEQDLEKLIDSVYRAVKEAFDINTLFGVGMPCQHWENILRSYREAQSALLDLPFHKKYIAFWNSHSGKTERESDMNAEFSLLEVAFKSGNCTLMGQGVSQTYHNLGKSETLTIRSLWETNEKIFTLIRQVYSPWIDGFRTEFEELCGRLRYMYEPRRIAGELLQFMEKYLSACEVNSENDVVSIIKKVIDSEEKYDYSLDEISMQFGISKQYFLKKFRNKYGITPYEYILNQKIERAKLLLIENSMTISEIVERLHFTDNSHFTKTFKKRVGVSPKSYREKL